MITVEIQVMDKDHLRKVMRLISNYNKLNDDRIEVVRAYEITMNEGNKKDDLKTNEHQ